MKKNSSIFWMMIVFVGQLSLITSAQTEKSGVEDTTITADSVKKATAGGDQAGAAQKIGLDESSKIAPADSIVVAQAKRSKASSSSPAAVGGREVTSTKDLYAAIPGEAKESKVVGGLVKSYTGQVDIICAKDTMVCIVTFKDRR